MPTAILFPHTDLSTLNMTKLSAHFDQLILYLPWHMDAPKGMPEEIAGHRLNVQYPPETMTPRENFTQLINDYKLWLSQNRG